MTSSSSKLSYQEDTAVIRLSASEIARQIAEGRLSSQEVVEAYIRRIEAVNTLRHDWASLRTER
jgi:Asp-tRNA(Asn)/Glu-tRNA(Gln) amidotransferase A subunit family amidase